MSADCTTINHLKYLSLYLSVCEFVHVCVWMPVKYAWYVVKVFTRAGKLADIILLSACILISSPGQTPSKLLDLLVIIVRREIS